MYWNKFWQVTFFHHNNCFAAIYTFLRGEQWLAEIYPQSSTQDETNQDWKLVSHHRYLSTLPQHIIPQHIIPQHVNKENQSRLVVTLITNFDIGNFILRFNYLINLFLQIWGVLFGEKRARIIGQPALTQSSLSFALASSSICVFNERIKIEVCASLYFQLHAYSSPDKAHKHYIYLRNEYGIPGAYII